MQARYEDCDLAEPAVSAERCGVVLSAYLCAMRFARNGAGGDGVPNDTRCSLRRAADRDEFPGVVILKLALSEAECRSLSTS